MFPSLTREMYMWLAKPPATAIKLHVKSRMVSTITY